jgi:hypothetical protein
VVVALVIAAAGSATSRTSAGPTSAASESRVLGISQRLPGGRLAWFDRRNLRKLPGRKAPLRYHGGSWAFSADRSVLAVAACDEQTIPSIRFVNARVMRVLGDVTVSETANCVSGLTWLRSDRMLALASRWATGEAEVAVVDPADRRFVRTTRLPGGVAASARTPDGLALLLETPNALSAARIAVVDAEGVVRTATVDDVLVGTVVDEESSDYRSRTVSPGFAVDPDGRRAFVVPDSGPVVEIDLRTLAMSRHELDRASFLQRVLRWLTPAAEAKVMEGPVRQAVWLGDGLLAVSGADYSLVTNKSGERLMRIDAVGARLVDTHFWQTRVLSPGSSNLVAAPLGLLVAEGGGWDPLRERSSSPGILGFGRDGGLRWKLHPGEDRWIDATSDTSYGYVYLGDGRAEVVDLASGKVVRTLRRDEQLNPWPQLLGAQTSSW